jgi:hypothetical protein
MTQHTGSPDARERASVDVLAEVANDLAGEFRLQPLLERILRSAVELLGCRSGSLCLIDQVSHTYRKEIDLDAGCQAGMVFSLDEGCTGAVARSGKPVIFEHYSEVAAGHIRPDEDRFHRAVIGVPILLRRTLIGACIVFAAADEQRFDAADAQLLQRFTTHAAIAIANSRLHVQAADRAKAAAVAAERERAMLEVHDSIGRGLATVALRIADAHTAASHGGNPLPALIQAQQAAQETMNEGHRAVWGLGPAGMAGRPIDQSIGLELDWVRATSDLVPTFRVFGDPRPHRTPGECARRLRPAFLHPGGPGRRRDPCRSGAGTDRVRARGPGQGGGGELRHRDRPARAARPGPAARLDAVQRDPDADALPALRGQAGRNGDGGERLQRALPARQPGGRRDRPELVQELNPAPGASVERPVVG